MGLPGNRTGRGARGDPANFKFQTGACTNQLNNIAIKGKFAFVPNTGASPNGPFRFDVNTHSLLSVINRTTNLDAGQTINMHTAVRDQTVQPKTFITLPWAMAFKHHVNDGYVISAASNFVVKLAIDPPPGSTPPITRRMSNNGWGACAACHTPFGTSDNVVWIFPSGPKRVIPQHTDFDQTDPTRSNMRVLNWVAERDEEEDFELNIRAVSGGQRLIVLDDGITQDPKVFNLVATPPAVSLPSGDRNQLKVRGVPAWDAIEAFEQFGIRAPISPLSPTEPDVIAGRALFTAANCQSCHGTTQWTTSRVDFQQPPPRLRPIPLASPTGSL